MSLERQHRAELYWQGEPWKGSDGKDPQLPPPKIRAALGPFLLARLSQSLLWRFSYNVPFILLFVSSGLSLTPFISEQSSDNGDEERPDFFFSFFLFFIYWPRAEQKARFWVRALVMVLLCSRKWDPLDDVTFFLNVTMITFQKPCATSNTWPDSWVLSAAQWPWFYGGLTQMFKKVFAVQRVERWGMFICN